jgi:hypothetical protein
MEFPKRNQKKFTKQNEILLLTKRNEISLFFVFRETSEISRNNAFVSLLFRVSRNKKKGCEMETLPHTHSRHWHGIRGLKSPREKNSVRQICPFGWETICPSGFLKWHYHKQCGYCLSYAWRECLEDFPERNQLIYICIRLRWAFPAGKLAYVRLIHNWGIPSWKHFSATLMCLLMNIIWRRKFWIYPWLIQG